MGLFDIAANVATMGTYGLAKKAYETVTGSPNAVDPSLESEAPLLHYGQATSTGTDANGNSGNGAAGLDQSQFVNRLGGVMDDATAKSLAFSNGLMGQSSSLEKKQLAGANAATADANAYDARTGRALVQGAQAFASDRADSAAVNNGITGLNRLAAANGAANSPVNRTEGQMQGLINSGMATNGLGGLQNFAANGQAGNQAALGNLNNFQGGGGQQAAMLQGVAPGGANQVQALSNFQGGGGVGQNVLAGLATGTGQANALAAQQGLYQLGAGPEAPSAAQALLRNQSDTNMANAIAMANSGRGAGQNAQALRAAMFANAATQQQTGNQMAALRAQEAQAAQQVKLNAFNAAGQQAQGITGQQATAAGSYEQAAQGMTAQQLQALAQSGQLAQGMTAQQMQALMQSGQLSQGASGQQLSALQSGAQLSSTMSGQQLGALQAYQQGNLGAFNASGQQLGTLANTQLQQAAQQKAIYDSVTQGALGLKNADTALYGQANSLAQGMGNLGLGQANLSANLLTGAVNNTQGAYNLLGQNQNELNTLGFNSANVLNTSAQNADQFGTTLNYNINRDNSELANKIALGNASMAEQRDAALMGMVGSAATGLASKSDERVKKNVETLKTAFGGSDLRPATGYEYEYKDPTSDGTVPGRTFGPMAQDLEKTKAGASTVFEGPDGVKRVHTGRLALVNTSAIADLQHRFLQLEKLVKREART